MSDGARRRLLLANVSLANGGLERQLLLLAKNLTETWDVRLWTLEGGAFAEGFRQAGIPWRLRERRFRHDPTPALDLWRLVVSWRPDVLHAWHWMPAAAAVPVCRGLGIPLIDGSIRMGSVPNSRVWPRRCIMCGADLVVANSRAGLEAFRIESDKGRVIYNAFDDDRLDGACSADPYLTGRSGPLTAVMAARMAPQKDFWSAIGAARRLRDSHPGSWRFLLVGDGEDRDALVDGARDLVSEGIVEFRNEGTEAINAIREAQVGILMTAADVWAEGCSNSIMEYMACGLPVVCSDTGGSPELVRDGREGFVIPSYDDAALAGRLMELSADPQLRLKMGAAGRKRIEGEFTVDRMVAKYQHIYDEVLAGRRV